ncbi:hypothetical protein B0T17DRAFT_618271 [Bombardia bombarda]|uniref:Auxin efflux carrier n=1 Tax=Bombardia bombarda TaxID=252184 RepID=A0AA39WV40_9PEZI|nr:hypothetical protein B0T17DRAFT_618271 [Bombardia bombarda]
MAPLALATSFLAGVQSSLSILVTMSFGGIAAYHGLLKHDNAKAVSKLCVRMFLPALLITELGAHLHSTPPTTFLSIFLWATFCHSVSFVFGIVTAAIMFNNTTAFPLFLFTALHETGILQSLVARDDETSADALNRAKSYILVYGTISNCITFAVGPRLIDTEHAPEPIDDTEEEDTPERTTLLLHRPGRRVSYSTPFRDPFSPTNSFFPSARRHSFAPSILRTESRRASIIPKTRWQKLGPRVKWYVLFLADFFNPPLLGAMVGFTLGLVPFLHGAFFERGGVFTAWFTVAMKNMGALFVTLPVVVSGVSLYTAIREARENDRANRGRRAELPGGRTGMMGGEPVFWFTMMLVPTGPSAMKLITLLQVSGGEQEDEISIVKLLTISYIVSPVLSVAVVGSLVAARAAVG